MYKYVKYSMVHYCLFHTRRAPGVRVPSRFLVYDSGDRSEIEHAASAVEQDIGELHPKSTGVLRLQHSCRLREDNSFSWLHSESA